MKRKYAWSVKVGEKGQIVIPKEARDIFGISPGDSIIILGDSKRGMAIPPQKEFERVAALVFNEKDVNKNYDTDEADKQ